jgi:signal transduction histidine kinase
VSPLLLLVQELPMLRSENSARIWSIRYGAALAAVVVAAMLKSLVASHVGLEGSFLLLLVPVVFSAWFCGLGPGLLATIGALVLADYFFLLPVATFSFGSGAYNAALGLFALEAIAAVGLTAFARRKLSRAAAQPTTSQQPERRPGRLFHARRAIGYARRTTPTQHALRRSEALLATAAHEIRSPLTSLLGYTQLLVRRNAETDTLTERDRTALGRVYEQARLLHNRVEALLDLERLHQGQLGLQRAPLDLCGLLPRLTDELRSLFDRHTLIYNCSDEALIVLGDELRLRQVFENLLRNAVTYSPHGGRIMLTATRRGEEAWVMVCDQGIGIPRHAQPLVFQRFYRAENARNHSAVGLGVFIVREIVARHDGKIDLESTEGSGSCFTVRLPLQRVAATDGAGTRDDVGHAASNALQSM